MILFGTYGIILPQHTIPTPTPLYQPYSQSYPLPVFTTILTNNTSPYFSNFVNYGCIKDPMREEVLWKMVLLCPSLSPRSMDRDNRAHNHWFLSLRLTKLVYCKKQSLRIDSCGMNGKPITPHSPMPST